MSMLHISLFGGFRVVREGTGEVVFTRRKVMGLLAFLAMEAAQAHSRESLMGLLWSEMSEEDARNNLRVALAHLRNDLENDTSEVSPLTTTRKTVRFPIVQNVTLDVASFEALLTESEHCTHANRSTCPLCQERMTQAVELYKGPLMQGFFLDDCPEFDDWLFVERERLHLQVTLALEQLAAFHERAGQLAEAERVIRRLLEYDPLSEAVYRQLMRVLARADQRSTALEVYETCRRVLAAELGLAPAVETVTLAEQIRGFAPVESHSNQTDLPPVLTRFLGRQQESARLIDLLSRRTVRLVTLMGPGGVGKTRLAIEVAHRMEGVFAHDICFVELAGVADGSAVDGAVAAALRLPTNTGRSSTNAIVDYLRDKTLLLVLDNCEHVVKACTRLVQTLCREATGLTVLATSRIPLHLAEEQVVRLEPFATPTVNGVELLTVPESMRFDAIQLFVDRATQSLLSFTLTDANVQSVIRICQQLDGIPLAIEIAAAQARALPVEAIAERLSQRFVWLNKRSAEAVSRQRTLHTLIDWSYGLLSVHQRSILRRLAVFAGGWTLEAAEAISEPGEPCAELLAELVEHSLVVFGNDVKRQRYSMHETIRQFAQEHLHGSNQEADVLERHARYYAQIVSRAEENEAGQTLPERLYAIQDDHDNVQRAFEWLLSNDHKQALTLVAQLGTLKFWELRGFFQEGRRWLQRVLDETQASFSIQRAQALLAAADLSSAISDFDYGLQCARQAQELFQELGDQRGEIDARLTYCELAHLAGEYTDLQAQTEQLLQMAENISYVDGIAKARLVLGTIAFFHGNEVQTAVRYLLPSIALWRKLNKPFELATALNRLAGALNAINDHAAAQLAFEECRNIYQSLGYRRGVATVTQNLGGIAFDLGDYVRTRALFCDSLRIRRELGLQRGYAYSFEFIADVDEIEKRYERAVQLLAAAETLRVRIRAPIEQINQKENEDALTRLRRQLGDTVFELEWAKGATMSTEQAIVLALS